MKFRFLLLIITLLLLGKTVSAATPESVLVNITPESPTPREEVTITLSSFSNNLDTVSISWFTDGTNVSSGIGKKTLRITAPAAGSETVVVARLAIPDGAVEKRIVIRPNVMVLLWQANDSYVPPFYRGKALPSLDSEIKVVAMPEVRSGGVRVSSSNMTYAWKRDYTNDAAASGYGKNFFIYTNDYLENSNTVSVTATTVNQSSSSEASVTVRAAEPKILFYKMTEALGVLYNMALPDTHRIAGSELVVAIPYYISPKELQHPSLVWSWFINNAPADVIGYKKNVIPLQTQSGVSGISKLRLEIENRDKIFQTASKEINIEF
jgi:hypothetical protein